MKEKSSSAISIIGGADGPTSVWIAGKTKEKNLLRRLRNNIRKGRYRKKRDRALADLEKNMELLDKQVHSLEELRAYIEAEYGAVALQQTDREYQMHLQNCRAALVQKHRPDLLGEPLEKLCPENFEDMAAVENYMKKVEEYHRKACQIPEESFPMDYHYYNIMVGDGGRVHVELEFLHNVFLCGCSAEKDKQKMAEAVMQDIYRYYGMTREDLENKTERFHSYLAVMTI